MADKTLATFRVDLEKWEAFKNMASADGSNASAVLIEFLEWYLAGNRLDASAAHTPTTDDTSVQKRLDNVEQRLDKVTASSLDNLDELIDKRIEERLAARLDEVRSQMEELRGKLPA